MIFLLTLPFIYRSRQNKNIAFLIDEDGEPKRSWKIIEQVAKGEKKFSRKRKKKVALIHLSSLLGRTFEETLNAYNNFGEDNNPDRLFKIIYHLGKVSFDDLKQVREREIHFSAILKERVGHHYFGEKWANHVKQVLGDNNLLNRPLHIISANMHSVKNMLFANDALKKKNTKDVDYSLYEEISNKKELRDKVLEYAISKEMIYIDDNSGSNIDVQLIDLSKVDLKNSPFANSGYKGDDVLMVFDYAFGEQAYEVMDELLRPFEYEGNVYTMNVKSVSIMGKAGILTGEKRRHYDSYFSHFRRNCR